MRPKAAVVIKGCLEPGCTGGRGGDCLAFFGFGRAGFPRFLGAAPVPKGGGVQESEGGIKQVERGISE